MNYQCELSSHLHFIANIKRAIALEKPVLILIRQPADAISSYMIYRGGSFPAEQAILEYIDFYTYVLGHRDHVVLASFEEVTGDFGKVIGRVNQRFATAFTIFEQTPDNVQRCKDEIGSQQSPWFADKRRWSADRNRSIPTQGRAELKQQAYKTLSDPRLRGMMNRAETLYKKLT